MRRTERGSTAVLGAGIFFVGGLITVFLLEAIGYGHEMTTAQRTADLAAISAAQRLADGADRGEACTIGRTIVMDQIPVNPTITCEVEGNDVGIYINHPTTFLGFRGEVEAYALAGPANVHARKPFN